MLSSGRLRSTSLLALLTAFVVTTALPAEIIDSPIRFDECSELGFGDRNNSKAWSMIWWKDHLYVGTARSHLCMDWAGLALLFPDKYEYPPLDQDLACPPSMAELPLQAEIWRFSPLSETWTRVFQSPLVPNPIGGELSTARDAGFRNLFAFKDPDGEQALYAAGITSESLFPGMPPPRILRTTDGENWDPIPQDPGTLLGDLGRGEANFRAAAVYKDKLYIVNGNLRGSGRVLESANPAAGNDSFRPVTPPGTVVFEMVVYNGYLYLGLGAPDGYRVVKTDATGSPPYTLTPIVELGAYREYFPSQGVASMYVFGNRLYVGTDKPAELIRINPDDSWDLIIGAPRETPQGWKEPLSGLGQGLDYLLTNHFHRMVEHQGRLFMSTNDATGFLRPYLVAEPFLDSMGFDLAYSEEGNEYSLMTATGLKHPFDLTMRVFASTPFGLAAGTSNPWEGLRMYLGQPTDPRIVKTPLHLTLQNLEGPAVLSWRPATDDESPWPEDCDRCLYRVFKRTLLVGPQFEEIGATPETVLVDADLLEGRSYHYYVVAQDYDGNRSLPSNLARSPALLTPMSARGALETLQSWNISARILGPILRQVEALLLKGDSRSARALVESLSAWVPTLIDRQMSGQSTSCGLPPDWRLADLALVLERLLLRIEVADSGLLPTVEVAGQAPAGCDLPPNLELSGQTISTCYLQEACRSIVAGPDFRVDAGGDALLRAGEVIALGNGFSVASDASFTAAIDPLLGPN